MQLKRKINLKVYLPMSMALLILASFFCTGPKEILVVITVFFAVVLNQWMLLTAVDALITSAKGGENSNSSGIIFSFLGKAIILIIAISLGVHIMGNRIIIPILIYIAQIFVLYFSLNEDQGNHQD
jgi:hypothetical protein